MGTIYVYRIKKKCIIQFKKITLINSFGNCQVFFIFFYFGKKNMFCGNT